MWKFCNDDRSLIKVGTRKAPKITEKEFMEKIKKWVSYHKKLFIGEDSEYIDDLEEKCIIIEDINDFKDLSDDEILYLFAISIVSYVSVDINFIGHEVCVCSGEKSGNIETTPIFLNGFHILSNGLPILGMTWYDYHNVYAPLFFCIYWDGKSFRSYVPRYGNPFNVVTKTVFGDERRGKGWEKFYSDIVRLGHKKHKTYNDLYCLIYGDNDEVFNIFNSDAMEEDIVNRITVY